MNRSEIELDHPMDRTIFVEVYSWGTLLSCWMMDGIFCHHKLYRAYAA